MSPEYKNNKTVIVIGAGPAGMMAAGQAASKGIDTYLFEKEKTSGRKLSITGKGRCNLTNIEPLADFIKRFGKNGKFLRQPFNNFFSDDLASFLKDIGVDIKQERGGRVFPENDDAPSVTRALENWVKHKGVKVQNRCAVKKIVIKNNKIEGVETNIGYFQCHSVIIATGGLSYPKTGSTGDGYKLAQKLGHTIVPTRPALIPLETKGKTASKLMGLSLKNVNLSVFTDSKKSASYFGEMIFTHFGLSGPIVLTASRDIVDALNEKKKIEISIDLKPALDNQKLEQRLLRDLNENSNKQLHSILKNLLPSKLIPVCCELLKIDPNKKGNQLSGDERKKLRLWLKDFRFEVSGYRPIEEAIVTAGGIALNEINPKTMGSKIIENLYFAGEILDIDGETGGYNLQASFSTGYLAGSSIDITR